METPITLDKDAGSAAVLCYGAAPSGGGEGAPGAAAPKVLTFRHYLPWGLHCQVALGTGPSTRPVGKLVTHSTGWESVVIHWPGRLLGVGVSGGVGSRKVSTPGSQGCSSGWGGRARL